MKRPTLIVAMATASFLGGAAVAEDNLQASLTCIDEMATGRSWDECRALIFAPCEALGVGGAEHMSCLRSERDHWASLLGMELAQVQAALTEGAAADLPALMEGWHVSVATKCEMVSADRAGISAEAAWVGCEIVETAGLTSAMQQCRLGQSSAEFCDRRDQAQ